MLIAIQLGTSNSGSGLKMRNVIFLVLAIHISAAAHSGTQGKDFKKLNQLFQDAEVDGPDYVRCGRESEQKKMLFSIDYLELAYKKLNREFPVFSPRLVEQLHKRFEIVCSFNGCAAIDKSSYSCTRLNDKWAIERLEQFDSAVADAEKRLSKLKSGSAISASAESCPQSAQYYQDAYISNLRVSDLECFRRVLERQRRY